MVLAAGPYSLYAQPDVVEATMKALRAGASTVHRNLTGGHHKSRLQPIKRPNGAGFMSGQCMYCGVETAAARPPDARMGVWFECLLCREQYDCHVCGHNDYWYNGEEKLCDVFEDVEHNIHLTPQRSLALARSMKLDKSATLDDWRTARKLHASKARAVNAKRRAELFYARCMALMERMGVEHARFLAETAMSDP